MHKNILWIIFAILCVYFSLVCCEVYTGVQTKNLNTAFQSDGKALEQESRPRRKHHHYLYSLWSFYGLAVAFLIKIKAIVVAFFVGSAVYLGLRYWWPNKCVGSEIYKEGSLILDHPPSFTQYDHIPYSLDHEHSHHYDSESISSFDPYAAYAGHSFSDSGGYIPSRSYTASSENFSSEATQLRRKRSDPIQDNIEIKTDTRENLGRQLVVNEEGIGDFMFVFLGLDTAACRRRFICEMEFKSKANSLTSMAFRVIGRSFFAKYINSVNPLRKAKSFEECAAVNAECVFIEHSEETIKDTEQPAENMTAAEQVQTNDGASEATPSKIEVDNYVDDVVEKKNENNLKTELRTHSYRRRLKLKNINKK